MPFADQASTRIAYVPETVFGTTPATPAFKTFRTTRAAGLRTNKGTKTSDEIRADRNVADLAQTSQGASGDYPIELSYGSFDDFIEAVLCGTWTTNVLKNGVTSRSFTVEETRKLGAGSSFSRFTGVMLDKFSLSMSAGEIVTGTFSLKGQKEGLASAIVTGATYAAASTEPVMNATANVASLVIPNLTTPKIKSFSLSISNNLRDRPYIGSLYSDEFGLGRCLVEGSIQAYFTEQALYQAVLDHGGGALAFTIGAATLKKYTFSLPNIVFGDGEVPAGGNDEDVMVNIPFTAIYNTADLAQMKITRAVA